MSESSSLSGSKADTFSSAGNWQLSRSDGAGSGESSKGLTSLTSTDATVDILTDRSEGPERNPTMLGTARHAGTGVFTAKHPAPPAPIISGEATSAFTLSDESDEEQDVHVFVGDLANNVTDAVLHKAFSAVGPCREARVMWDHGTNRSKGYGFVSFYKREHAEHAIESMQGKLVGSRRVRVGWAAHKKEQVLLPVDYESVDRASPTNTNVYVGNVSSDTNEADLRRVFARFGMIKSIKLHARGGYGFVNYVAHDSALRAIVGLHGAELNGQLIRCSWGKLATEPLAARQPALLTEQQDSPLHHLNNMSSVLPKDGCHPALAGFNAQAAQLGLPLQNLHACNPSQVQAATASMLQHASLLLAFQAQLQVAQLKTSATVPTNCIDQTTSQYMPLIGPGLQQEASDMLQPHGLQLNTAAMQQRMEQVGMVQQVPGLTHQHMVPGDLQMQYAALQVMQAAQGSVPQAAGLESNAAFAAFASQPPPRGTTPAAAPSASVQQPLDLAQMMQWMSITGKQGL